MNATIPMNQTTASSSSVKRGFPGLHCPACGETDSMTVNLCEVTVFKCQECDEEQSVEDIQAMLSAWQKMLTWIDAAPAIAE